MFYILSILNKKYLRDNARGPFQGKIHAHFIANSSVPIGGLRWCRFGAVCRPVCGNVTIDTKYGMVQQLYWKTTLRTDRFSQSIDELDCQVPFRLWLYKSIRSW